MNANVPPIIPEATGLAKSPVHPQKRLGPSRLNEILFAPIKLFVGMALCQSILGSLAVLGWTYRFMQRAVLKRWWRVADQRQAAQRFADFVTEDSSARPHWSWLLKLWWRLVDQHRAAQRFAGFVASDSQTCEHLHWPNWFLAQNFREAAKRSPDSSFGKYVLTLVQNVLVSFWTNVRIGVQGIFNTWVLTLPGGILWLFAWFAGWNNSFNKGYEQAWIGPATGFAGILLFIGAMLYVPLAQARQAVTGDWRRFYDFRLVWTLIRRHWRACLGLALLYSLCSIPIVVLIVLPSSFQQISPALNDVTTDDVQTIVWTLRRYFFWSALVALPAFVLVRFVAARIYGSAVLKAVQSGGIAEDVLAESEWQALHRLGLLQIQPARQRHPVVRAIAWAATRAGRITFGIATSLIWFTFVSQVFIAQFFSYHTGPTLWLNNPLVQLPWLLHLPAWLRNPWSEIALVALLVFVCWRLKKATLWVKSVRRSSGSG